MSKFLKWVKAAAASLVDPDKEQRINQIVGILRTALATEQQSFSLERTMASHPFSATDVHEAGLVIYRDALNKGWQDGILNQSEQNIANWLAYRLGVTADEAQQLNLSFARFSFGSALAKAMEDGVLTPTELATLQAIASSVGATARDFAHAYFSNESEGFLRAIFLACVADGTLSDQEWGHLIAAATELGISQKELLASIAPHAQQFVEHVLADAKSDGNISPEEEQVLYRLAAVLGLPANFVQYLHSEISNVRRMFEISQGRLATIAAPAGMETKAGELIYFYAPAVWRETKHRQSGVTNTDHAGALAFTDNRLIFQSVTKAQSFSYARVISHRGGVNWLSVQIQAKPETIFVLQSYDPFAYAIFQTAIAMANQTKVSIVEGNVSRHISREVRQRVWQRYGGKCVECGASDYLEYDHIIPFSRGGNSSENNIQILCRRCNLKKSDHI